MQYVSFSSRQYVGVFNFDTKYVNHSYFRVGTKNDRCILFSSLDVSESRTTSRNIHKLSWKFSNHFQLIIFTYIFLLKQFYYKPLK